MAGTTAFPTALDTFPDILPDTQEDAIGFEHDTVHNNEAAAIAALQEKVGIDASADPTSLDARVTALEGGGGGATYPYISGQIGEVAYGDPCTTTLTMENGVGATVFDVFTPPLPDGISLSAAGVYSGTFLGSPGNFSWGVSATDSRGVMAFGRQRCTVVSPEYPVLLSTATNNTTGTEVSTLVVNIPTHSAGDLILAVMEMFNIGSVTLPAGWVSLGGVLVPGGSGHSLHLAYKIAGVGGEGASANVTLPGLRDWTVRTFVISAGTFDPIDPAKATFAQATPSGSTFSFPENTGWAGKQVLAIAAQGSHNVLSSAPSVWAYPDNRYTLVQTGTSGGSGAKLVTSTKIESVMPFTPPDQTISLAPNPSPVATIAIKPNS